MRRLLCFLRPLEQGGRAVVHMGPLHRLQAQRHASSIFPAGPRGPWVSSLPQRLFRLGQPDPARYVFFLSSDFSNYPEFTVLQKKP